MTVPLVSSALELRSAFVLMQTSNCQPHTGEVDDVDDDDDIFILYVFQKIIPTSSGGAKPDVAKAGLGLVMMMMIN